MKRILSLFLSSIMLISITIGTTMTIRAATNASAKATVESICATSGFIPGVNSYGDCYKYAKAFCEKMYGANCYPGGIDSYNFSRPGSFYRVDQTYGTGVTASTLSNVLSKAMPGDVLQMRWQYTSNGTLHQTNHTAIVYESDSSSITFLHDGATLNPSAITKSTYYYSSAYTRWCGSGLGISLYRHNNYNNLFPSTTTPTYASVSTDKYVYGINEQINMSFSADAHIDKYKVQIWFGDAMIYSYETNESSLKLSCAHFGAGQFAAYVTASNSMGYCTSSTITFFIAAQLSNPQIFINKNIFDLGDTILLSASVEGGADYFGLQIWKGSDVVYQKTFTGHEISLNSSELGIGEYAAIVSCVNASGSVTTETISFTVGSKLSNPKISITQNRYSSSDTICIRVSVDGGADYYGIQIWQGNNVVYQKSFTGHEIMIPCSELGIGEYVAFVNCVNALSTVKTDDISFVISDTSDPSVLISAIEEAHNYSKAEYTAESIQALIDTAESYSELAKTNAPQTEYDAAVKVILEAIANLDSLSNYAVSAFDGTTAVLVNEEGNETTVTFSDNINGYCAPLDVVEDGIINAKDFAYLLRNF